MLIVGVTPISRQLRFKLFIPFGVAFAIMSPGTITKPIRNLYVFIGRLTTRRYWLLAGSLLHGIANTLVGIGLFATEVVLRLVPIALKGRFDTFPTGFVFLIPPFWISFYVHV